MSTVIESLSTESRDEAFPQRLPSTMSALMVYPIPLQSLPGPLHPIWPPSTRSATGLPRRRIREIQLTKGEKLETF